MTKTSNFSVLAAALAVVLAAGLLMLVGLRPAEAAFPGTNGSIVFESSRVGQTNIFAMAPTPGAQATVLTNINQNGPKEEPVVSPDGKKIAYVFGRDIWVMNSDGSGPTNLTNDANFNDEPAWSADGSKIAFSRDFDLFTMNADGTGKTNITNTASPQESQPAWSPDGAKIAYNSSACVPGGGNNCIYKTNADGTGTPTNLTPETNVPCSGGGSFSHQNVSEHPSWSPGGTQIAFRGSVGCAGTSGLNIWVMNADGSGKTSIISDNATSDDQPAYSPDGTQIVFESNRDASSGELYTIPATGGAITRLTTNSAIDENADWGKPPPPSNDDFASAQTITGSTAAVPGTTASATRETFEPDHDPGSPFVVGEHSVWYVWTVPGTGQATLDACTSDFDLILAVYTGNEVRSLSRVALSGVGCASGPGSKVNFNATAGTTYRVVVSGAEVLDPEGSFTLGLNSPPDNVAPTVSSVNPPDLKKKVPPKTDVTATFSEDMEASTVEATTFTLVRKGGATPVAAVVGFNPATKKATLNPDGKLRAGKTYVATVKGGSGGAKDPAGNALATDRVWQFTIKK
jgi:Tol biopolymer transport system component